MKKFVAIIMAVLMMCVVLTGCFKSENTPSNNVVEPDLNHDEVTADEQGEEAVETTKKPVSGNGDHNGFACSMSEFEEKISKLLDLELFSYDEEDFEDDYIQINLKSENKKSFDFDYTIKIGNEKIVLPVSFTEMKNSAFKTEINEDFPVSNKITRGPEYTTSDGKVFTLWTTNLDALFDDADMECEIKDCIFYKFKASVYDEEFNDNDTVYYEKNEDVADFDIYGITPDSTVEDVIAAMGNPTYITYSEESNSISIAYNEKIGNSGTSADTSSLLIRFFADQNCIENIEYEYAPSAVH